MELKEYRAQIDQIDAELVELFVRRMEIAAEIGSYKKERGLPVLDAEREREKLLRIAEMTPEGDRQDVTALFEKIMELSRGRQSRLLNET